MNLTNQHVVVIGGSSGIGLGIARASLEAGASVTISSRSPEKLAEAARQLGAPSRLRTFAADVTEEAQVRQLFSESPPVHHVVVTAAQAQPQSIKQLDLAVARRTFDAKVMAALLVAKHARFESGGSLTLTTGAAAVRPGPSGAVICAANGALNSLVRALALELAPVRVNALSPGWVDTPLWDKLLGDGRTQRFEQHARRLPVGRMGTPADLAHAALFLMGNGFTTAEVLNVDGGHTLI